MHLVGNGLERWKVGRLEREHMELQIRRALSGVVSLGVVGCAPPVSVEFFSAPAAAYEPVRSVVDTVLVRQRDSSVVSTANVRLAYDILDRARTAQRSDVVQTVELVLNEIPADQRPSRGKRGREEDRIVRIARGQGYAVQMDLMRSDVIVVQQIRADTVEVMTPVGEDKRELRSWVALIVVGSAYSKAALATDEHG